MQGENGRLEYGRELPYLDMKDSFLGSILRRMIDASNTLATNAGVTAVGETTPPPKIDTINVQGTLSTLADGTGLLTAPSEILHWTLTHNQSIAKGIRYFTEIDTSPSFPQPHVVDHGTSRSGFLSLPTNTSDTTPVQQTYYMRSYAQYPGSKPSEPTVFGSLQGATKIQMTGTSNTSLLSSTGSGTAQASGQQGGKGLGTVLKRPTPQAKRQARKF